MGKDNRNRGKKKGGDVPDAGRHRRNGGRHDERGGKKKGGDVPDARETAYQITRRVHSKGGYLGLLIRYNAGKSGLSARDRSLVAELCYGLQRHRNKIDHLIAYFSNRSLDDIDPEVLDILRLGFYQLSEMGTPPHAAVNETVELAKRHLGKGAGFVNAVLRRAVVAWDEVEWPTREDLAGYLEIVQSHPRWLVEYLIKYLGAEDAEGLCLADNRIPTLSLRVNLERTEPSALLEEIASHGWAGTASRHFPEALVGVGMPYDALMRWLQKGLCVVQDESSMAVSHVVRPGEGKTVVDACAAPGGKTTHLAQLGGESCRVVAVDRNRRRLKALRKVTERLGLQGVEIVEGDATRLRELVGEVDAVLLDAPCSGLGTLQRNPELKWRRYPGDIANLATVQARLLRGCAEAVKPGGVMVYSVCTFTRGETVRVVGDFLHERDDFSCEDPTPYIPRSLASAVVQGKYIQLMPHRHDMEGMFIARLRRRG